MGTTRTEILREPSREPKLLYLRLLWNNLGVHPLRSALSAVAIGLQVFLILLIVGLTTGLLSDWRSRAEGVGADIVVQAQNSSIFFPSANIPESLAANIGNVPGVDEVAPVYIYSDLSNLGVVIQVILHKQLQFFLRLAYRFHAMGRKQQSLHRLGFCPDIWASSFFRVQDRNDRFGPADFRVKNLLLT